ncbi:hypothetical protein FLG15_23065 (plasmid) [Xanthomonas phaseoli pv. dieffenbachiae]
MPTCRRQSDCGQAGRVRCCRPADMAVHARIVVLRDRGETIANTGRLAGASVTAVKRVWAAHCAQGYGN